MRGNICGGGRSFGEVVKNRALWGKALRWRAEVSQCVEVGLYCMCYSERGRLGRLSQGYRGKPPVGDGGLLGSIISLTSQYSWHTG